MPHVGMAIKGGVHYPVSAETDTEAGRFEGARFLTVIRSDPHFYGQPVGRLYSRGNLLPVRIVLLNGFIKNDSHDWMPARSVYFSDVDDINGLCAPV